MKLFSLLPKRLIHFACNSPGAVLFARRRAPRVLRFAPGPVVLAWRACPWMPPN